ncbi:MAG TPA: septum formation inhibitor Maf [Flavobacteriaceae bacterium]|nr:septum formation inhibitor Maf [Flavobacteriaceae bacterium]
MQLKLTTILLSCLFVFACKEQKQTSETLQKVSTKKEEKKLPPAYKPNQQFKDYWYAGKAEITSYTLEQARYGELRDGKAVLVYVTEPFLPKVQVKADQKNPKNVSILKLNATKKFNTGIYPYSIMQSTFYPVANNQHALKVSASIQEWCGQVYTQINNREQFEITSHSYFEGEADQNFNLEKAILENEIWTQLRIDPKSLPTGDFKIIPSLEYIRLKHKPLKAYNAFAEISEGKYTLSIEELDKKLSIYYEENFPFSIQSWEETIDGLTTKATKLKTINTAYWNQNSNTDSDLRKTLELD